MTKTLVVSDIHIGDLRLSNIVSLNALLLTEPYDRLVLAGDIIDLWTSNCVEIFENNFFELLKLLSEKKDVIWLVGNHDYDILKYNVSAMFPKIKIAEFFKTTDGGKKFLILHGNQVYKNKDISFVVKLVTKLNYFFWKCFGLDVQKLSNNTKYYSVYVDKKRKKIIKKFGNDCDVIIMGHTHKTGHVVKENVELFDIGSFLSLGSYAIIENGIVKIEKNNG